MATSKMAAALRTLILLSFLVPASVFGYEETAVANGGSIKGKVKLSGKAPKLPPLDVTKFKEVCQNVPNETLVIGPGQGIRYAVMTLEGITKGQAIEREVVHEIDNVNCRFLPHVVAASVGQFILFKNSDPILHTAHAFFQNGQPQFNVGLYPGRASRKPLLNAGVVKILCEVHPWMNAYVVVTEHPYHAVSDMYGDYEIRDVPPGVYKLKVWHESLGVQEKQVEVKSGGAAQADFNLSAPSGAKK